MIEMRWLMPGPRYKTVTGEPVLQYRYYILANDIVGGHWTGWNTVPRIPTDVAAEQDKPE